MTSAGRASSGVHCAGEQSGGAQSLFGRLLTRKAGRLLLRDFLVSSGTFVLGLALMWLMVERFGSNDVFAAGASFVAANSIHYVLAQGWVFRGSDRGIADGYIYFLVNAAVGLVITVLLFTALTRWTGLNYLLARVVVSVFAGLAIFVLNATLNFKRL